MEWLINFHTNISSNDWKLDFRKSMIEYNLNKNSIYYIATYDSFFSKLNLEINGIGKESAIFLKFMPQFYQVYATGKYKGKSKLETTQQFVNYFRECFEVENTENAYMTLLNSKYELIKTICIAKYRSEREVEIDETLIEKELSNKTIKYIVIFHTHPYSVRPSTDDCMSTVRIMMACGNEQKVVNHIIVGKKDYFSFKDANVMEELQFIANHRLNRIKVGDPKSYIDIMSMIEKGNG